MTINWVFSLPCLRLLYQYAFYAQINSGGDVPEEYQNLTTETSWDEMERVIIRRRGVHELECQVTEPGTVLQWEFVTTDHGINFGWYHKTTEMTKSSNAFNVVSVDNLF